MRSLWDSGAAHVAEGHTSQSELLRVAAPPTRVDARATDKYLPANTSPSGDMPDAQSVEVKVATVDVYVIRPLPDGWRVLVLRRGAQTRCPGSWEVVHGRIESGERPEQSATREVLEETGLLVERLYSITVQPFYLPSVGIVTAAVAFAAFVDETSQVVLADEHDACEWLAPADAERRFSWPRSKSVLRDIVFLLETGDAGPVEDVLRVS